MSWDQAKEKWADLVSTDEGFYISHQVRNGKRTAILAILYDKAKKENDKNKKAVKVFVVYRPNTGQQVLFKFWRSGVPTQDSFSR